MAYEPNFKLLWFSRPMQHDLPSLAYNPLSFQFYTDFFMNVTSTNMVTFTASLTCLLMLVLIKEGINNNSSCKPHLLMPVPIELIVVSSQVSFPYNATSSDLPILPMDHIALHRKQCLIIGVGRFRILGESRWGGVKFPAGT